MKNARNLHFDERELAGEMVGHLVRIKMCWALLFRVKTRAAPSIGISRNYYEYFNYYFCWLYIFGIITIKYIIINNIFHKIKYFFIVFKCRNSEKVGMSKRQNIPS